MCRWEKDEEERRIKEEGKREKAALATWRKWLMGLRIIERVREAYGGDADAHIAEEMNPFTNPSKAKKAQHADERIGSPPTQGIIPHADDDGDVGGGFLANDVDGGGFILEGHHEMEAPRRVGQLTIEDERGPVDRGSLNDSPRMTSVSKNHGPPNTDDSEGGLTGANLDGKEKAPKKALTDWKKRKAATSISGPEGNIPTNPPKTRAVPKRHAARKSETAFKSHFFENETDEDDNSNRGSLNSKEVAYQKPAKRKSNKDKASTFGASKRT